MTRPLNEDLLWKGQIQLANYPPPLWQPPMNLPRINSLTGKPIFILDIHTEMNRSYAAYSQKYWQGVEERKRAYRAARRYELTNNTPPQSL
jgi:hypothetical protein